MIITMTISILYSIDLGGTNILCVLTAHNYVKWCKSVKIKTYEIKIQTYNPDLWLWQLFKTFMLYCNLFVNMAGTKV